MGSDCLDLKGQDYSTLKMKFFIKKVIKRYFRNHQCFVFIGWKFSALSLEDKMISQNYGRGEPRFRNLGHLKKRPIRNGFSARKTRSPNFVQYSGDSLKKRASNPNNYLYVLTSDGICISRDSLGMSSLLSFYPFPFISRKPIQWISYHCNLEAHN